MPFKGPPINLPPHPPKNLVVVWGCLGGRSGGGRREEGAASPSSASSLCGVPFVSFLSFINICLFKTAPKLTKGAPLKVPLIWLLNLRYQLPTLPSIQALACRTFFPSSTSALSPSSASSPCPPLPSPPQRGVWRLPSKNLVVVWGCLGVVGGSLGLARPSPHPPAPARAVSGAQLVDFER